MNRIDRLTAIIIHLQSKRIVKAKEIAQRFEISLRTVYRDIRALEDAGVPIGAEPGKGYYIVEGYYLPPVMFTRDEAGALLMGGKLIDKFSDLSVQNHFNASLYKIKSVLSVKEKDFLDTLNTHIEVLNAAKQEKQGSGNNLLSEIQGILGQSRIIHIEYLSGYKDELTSRSLEPIGLCFYGSKWHLIAFCMLRKDYRDFRVDRIKRFSVTGETFQRETHDSLQNLVQKLVVSPDLKSATVRFHKSVVQFIKEERYYFGFIAEQEEKDWTRMDFMVHSYTYFANWLLTFVNKVEVVTPSKLQTRLQKISQALFHHYHKV